MYHILEASRMRTRHQKITNRLNDINLKFLENIICERVGQPLPYDESELYEEIKSIKNDIELNKDAMSPEAASYVRDLINEWNPKSQYKAGQKVVYNDNLYVVEKDIDTPVENWTPDIVFDYYTPIPKPNETGRIDNPIKAVAGMVYVGGCYYADLENIYYCTYNGEIKLNYLPSNLVGHYFTKIT